MKLDFNQNVKELGLNESMIRPYRRIRINKNMSQVPFIIVFVPFKFHFDLYCIELK